MKQQQQKRQKRMPELKILAEHCIWWSVSLTMFRVFHFDCNRKYRKSLPRDIHHTI